jgi:hypothetical protein
MSDRKVEETALILVNETGQCLSHLLAGAGADRDNKFGQ